MDTKTFINHMYPFWILGVIVMGAIIAAGQKKLLRIEKKPVLKWIAFLVIITLWRLLLSKFFNFSEVGEGAKQIAMLPLPLVATVAWEDLCHGLPLLILKKLVNVNKGFMKVLYPILMTLAMIEFGLGHLYQSLLAAFLLSFYIPYSVQKGEQYGFGTIIMCHILYDLVTLLFVRHLLGV